jgi:hypothetical protein
MQHTQSHKEGIQNVIGNQEGKTLLGRRRHRWKYNVYCIFREKECDDVG